MNQANQRYWDAMAPDWQALRDQDQLWRKCPQQPELAFDGEALAMIRQFVGDLHGKRVCVVGSGDNYAAFALAGMDACVTSTDISTRQLAVARQRAEQLGLDIAFVQADATILGGIGESEFDLVCSSNGFFVWIAEPRHVFQQVYRVLRPGGFYIFYDVHPFMRPWKDQITPLEMENPYTATGPFEYKDYGQANYQFHWRISDLINPLVGFMADRRVARQGGTLLGRQRLYARDRSRPAGLAQQPARRPSGLADGGGAED
jgi:ubiquinone/menaquinone biosynthesis C-methylase UbiE